MRLPAQFRLLFGLFSGLLLGGCPQPVVRDRPYAAPTAAELVAHLEKSRAGLFAMRARAKADVLGRAGRVKVDISLVAARPQKLRLAAENSLTGPLLTLATDGQVFQLLDVRENRFQSGDVSPCSMMRILGVALHPSQVIEVLLGGLPLLPEPTSFDVSWDGQDGGREILTMRDKRGVSEVIKLQANGPAAEGRAWDVREAEGRDDQGRPVWRLRHEGFSVESAGSLSVRLPSVTYIEDPPNKSDVRLRWKERELNPTIEPEVFHLDAPAGVPIDRDICAMAPAPAASPAP